MRSKLIVCALTLLPLASASAQQGAAGPTDPIAQLVGHLSLERYKATIKALTRFGDRRQGTDRNRAAIDWIEAQLKSYGCSDVQRLTYDYQPPPPLTDAERAERRARAAAAAGDGGVARAVGGGRPRGVRGRTGVNTDPARQPDVKLRALDSEPSTPGERQEVYCTKIGTTHPDEMYIVGGHMDGHGYGEAANDDGSGTALVMELARIFSSPDVQTDRSIRFVLWNNEETGLNGSRAYVEQRAPLQGKEEPAGSGKYPEPKWLGMIQHDMMMFDHGMPRPDGTMSPEQRPEADVNIEFQSASKQAAGAQALAWAFHAANEKYATDYPAQVGPHMTNTDSAPFQDLVPAISLRENERGTQIGSGWDPQWHQPTDLYATYSDKDFLLGLNAAQTTAGALAELAGLSQRDGVSQRDGLPRPEGQVTSAEQLVRAMHDRYSKTWYRTLSFKQTVTRTAADGTQAPKEVWAEYAEIPGKLRIDLAERYNGNGVIYANDSLYVFRDGALLRKSARRNALLVLGFDVYGQSPERTMQILREEKFDLSKLRSDTWQGRPVYVVGAEAGDLHSPQFWIDRERLLFVRLLEPQAQDTSKTSDIRFDDYRPLGKAWISPTVVFLVDGKEVMREEYFDMKADPALRTGLHDPARWGPVR